ncbi:porin [Cellvibrio sp. pealriver]|uniref:porin n=1 Tax=Cellvibrio sp. pealriver TaxID=1622269 RepID=UPI00066FF46A|nr:porin [Cellvibrio sp. pealriver]
MKKSLLALLIASVIPAAAFADVVVYGKANLSVQNADEAEESKLELVSNASRIGVKGSEEINSGLKAIYQFEYQTEVDDGAGGSSNQTFTQRNIYVGLQGSGGTIIGGHFDTPVKTAQEKVDLFNDLEGDINYLVDGETRSKNIVQYTTPASWGAFAINIAGVAAENNAADDGVSASVTYTTPAFYVALAAEQDVSAQTMDILRLVGRYTVGPVQLGALFEQSSVSASVAGTAVDLDSDAWLVSAKYNATDKFALKAQYGDAGMDVTAGGLVVDAGGDSLSLGADYLLSKNTTLFGYYTQETAEVDSDEVVDDNWIGVGIDLKF